MLSHLDLHGWDVSVQQAINLQLQLKQELVIEPLRQPPVTIAGCDISFNKFESTVYAGIVVLRLDTLETIEESGVVSEALFPYVPGLLTFREGPALLQAWRQLRTEPDVVMFDGHGIAHPRSMGIAAHMGLWLNKPAFGCAKSVLVGTYDALPEERGTWVPLRYHGTEIGAALRSKARTNPVFISPGHHIDLPASLDLTIRSYGGYRIPEPTRRAHNLVNTLRKGQKSVHEQFTLFGGLP